MMRITPELQQAMRYLQQKMQRAEASRFRYQETKMDAHRRAAEFDAHMLIGAAFDATREWKDAKMPPLGELLEREHQIIPVVATGGAQ